MTITIYEGAREEVEKRLAAMKKKAEKLGCTITYSIGEPFPQLVRVMEYDYAAHDMFCKDEYRVSAVDVEVSEEMIKRDGWTVVAKIEHLENGNLVTMFDFNAETPEAWRTVEPKCDHCHVNRFRAVTYMVEDEAGNLRQVGSGCLKEYTGIDPALAASWARIRAYLEENEADGEERERFAGVSRLVSVREVLAKAYDSVKANGFKSVNGPHSTADSVRCSKDDASEEGYKNADEIIGWMNGLDFDAPEARFIGSIIRDCVPLTKQGWCKDNHINRLAYIPVEWRKELERREKARKRAEEHEAETGSGYVGEVGKRMNFKVHGGTCLSSWETQYGFTYLYKFYDAHENVLVWYASGPIEDVELVREMKATVKVHNEYNGVHQTVLTRCTVTERETKPEPEHPAYSGKADEAFEMFWEYCEA
jgi:hypothetical protein